MSAAFDKAVEKVREKVTGSGLEGTFRFDIEGEGSILVEGEAVSLGEGEADVVVKADLDTFRELFDGSLSATQAFMTGQIEVEGDMETAMRLSALVE